MNHKKGNTIPGRIHTTATEPEHVEAAQEFYAEAVEPIVKLPIDFPNEGLNNLARKINEIIDRLN